MFEIEFDFTIVLLRCKSYPFDLPDKLTAEPSARSNTTIVFESVTPSGILRGLED